MVNNGPVHFVYLGGPFEWQHQRAIRTAAVHGRPVWLHSRKKVAGVDAVHKKLGVPDWLLNHPIQLANVKDLYAWSLLHRYGGLYLDLDTISLAPVWDLLPDDKDVCVSSEHEPGFTLGHPYNSAVVIGRQASSALADLRAEAWMRLAAGEDRWGKCGPHLLTSMFDGRFVAAPFGVLSGWRDDTIYRYYDGERPGPDVRVIHLYSSSRPDRFLADRWEP